MFVVIPGGATYLHSSRSTVRHLDPQSHNQSLITVTVEISNPRLKLLDPQSDRAGGEGAAADTVTVEIIEFAESSV